MDNTTAPTIFAYAHSNITITPLYESTTCITDTWRKKVAIARIVLNSLICVLGAIGNGLVIFTIGFQMKKTAVTIFFLNLAIADFTFNCFLPLSIVYLALGFQWPFGWIMCWLNGTILFLNYYSSVYFIMVISIDRWIRVKYPLWTQNHQTPWLASLVSLAVWILSLVLSSTYLYLHETELWPNNVLNCYAIYGLKQEKRHNYYAIVISRFTFGFVIPFSVIFACYVGMVLRLRRSEFAQSRKPFKVVTAVIVAFFVCWFPFHFFAFFDLKDSKDCDLQLSFFISYYLSLSLSVVNSCLNPILYDFMGHNYRERLRRSLEI